MIYKKNSLYNEYKKYTFAELEELLANAKTKEEKDFYASLLNMFLKREHKRVVEKMPV